MIASAVAMIPVKLYRQKDDGTVEPMPKDGRAAMLYKDTGDTINATNMKKLLVRDYLLKGSAYAYIERNYYGVPRAIYYVSPDDVAVLKNNDDIIHKTYAYSVRGKTYQPYDFLKILRYSDGYGKGRGIVRESPLILEMMYNLIKFQKNQVLRGGNKKGFLKTLAPVSKGVVADIKQGWSQLYSNENSENVMFLNGDIDFKEMSSTPVEMQLNESFKTNNDEIMKLFGTTDGILSKDTVKNAVIPVIDVFEAAFDSDLLLETEKRRGYYFAFDTRELTRGDVNERMTGYGTAIKYNIMTPDEARGMEDLPPLGFNPIRGGLNDVYIFPDKNKIYTPNTNAFVDFGSGSGAVINVPESIGEVRGNGENYTKDEYGKFNGSTSGGSPKRENDSEKALDKSQKSAYNEISALGENKFKQGFPQKILNEHWGGSHDHSDEYRSFTKEQYAARALELVQSAADGKKILGYKLNDGSVVRYDVKTNDYVKGHPHYGIYTMFKPKNHAQYFHNKKRDEGGIAK